MYTAVYTLASDGYVGRSRVRNPAPLYFFSCFMFSFLCATRITRHIRGTYVQKRATAQQKNKKNTRHMYAAVYRLAADGHVGRSRVRNPAPLYFYNVLCFLFCAFLFVYLHAHGGCVPCWYVCLYSSVHACCWSSSKAEAPLFNFKIYVFIFVCDTYQARTYNKGQHPNHKKKTRDTCIRTAVYTLAADGHVGRSRVRNQAPRY